MPKLPLAFPLVISLILILFFNFFLIQFGELLILTEARDYIAFSGWIEGQYHKLWQLLIPTGDNARYSSMFSFHFMKLQCGYDHRCINATQLGMSMVAGLLLSLHAYQIFRHVVTAAVITLLWLFSLPMLDATLWQAVNHDKLAALLSFTTLVTAAYFLQQNLTTRSIVTANLVITLLLILTYNAKESAFFVMPLLWFYVLLYTDRWQQGRKLLLPSLFGVYYVGFYYLRISEAWQQHVLSNSIEQNSLYFLKILFNQFIFPYDIAMANKDLLLLLPILLLILLVVKVVIGIIGWLLKWQRENAKREEKNLVYGLVFFILTMVIAMKTAHSAAYYMLIPLAGFLFSLAAIARTYWHNLLPPTAANIGVNITLIGLSLFMLNTMRPYWHNGSYYQSRLLYSTHFAEVFRTVRRRIPLRANDEYVLAYPVNIPDYFYFLNGDGPNHSDPRLLNFIYRTDGQFNLRYAPYQTLQDIDFVPTSQRHLIVIDQQYNLVKLQ